jgi:multiple sugar transport system ATP-binding protein
VATIELAHVTKRFENGTEAIKDVSLDIADGEFVVLVGPSGCGKSTLLRMIAGLDSVTSGDIRIDGRWVNSLPPKDRDIAMVFQGYALYPHMTVAENIAFSLNLRHTPKEEVDRRVEETAELLELDTLLDRRPRALSGGQRQRVAMGRAIVRSPKVFLMDEPLSNLDAKLRVQMRADIAEIQERLGVTTVYVTHDQVEAMTMADRVAVMRRGTLQQVDHPQAIYDRPVNLFVAAFIGSPPMNLVEARLETVDGRVCAVIGSQRLTLDQKLVEEHRLLIPFIDSEEAIAVGIRPEDIEDAKLAPSPADQQLEVHIDRVASLGADVEVYFELDAAAIPTDEARVAKGEAVVVPESVERASCVATLSPRTTIVEGATARLTVDTSRMHFFDPETRLRL